jgi:amidase
VSTILVLIPAQLDESDPSRPIRVALTTDPARQGVDPAVAEAVLHAGLALEHAGYAVEEAEPPSVDATADLWWRLAWNETRQILVPTIRKWGDEGINRALDHFLASTPDVDLVGYMKDVAERARHLREWLQFLERYPLIVGPVSTEPPFPVGFDLERSKGIACESLFAKTPT